MRVPVILAAGPALPSRPATATTSDHSTPAAAVESSAIQRLGRADVARARARTWRRRVLRLAVGFCLVDGYLWYRDAIGRPVSPSFPQGMVPYLPALLLV